MGKKIGVYELGKTLGEGSFGKVKYAVNTETGEAVAIKVLSKEKIQQQGMGQQVKKEISIMKQLRHPNVVQLREVLASKTKIFIVLQLVTGGELFAKIVQEGRFSENQARFYFHQLIAGVEYCHDVGVCHRDLKPENLLLDEEGNLKISDFGLSALYGGAGDSRAKLLHTTCGTPNYVAPEVLADRGYDGRTADVWSCGVILYVLLAAFLPFDEPTMSALFRKIQKAEFTFPAWFSADVVSLLSSILVADPLCRTTIPAIKSHPWFTTEGQYRPSPSKTKEVIYSPPCHEDLAGAIQEGVVERLSEMTTRESPGAAGGEEEEDGEPPLESHQDWLNRRISTKGRLALHGINGSDGQLKRLLHFPMSSQQDVGHVMQAIADALREEGCEVRVHGDYEKTKATKLTPKGMIGIVFEVRSVGSGGDEEDEQDEAAVASPSPGGGGADKVVHFIEVRRGRGDILEYAQFLNDFVDHKINHLVEGHENTTTTTLASPPGAK